MRTYVTDDGESVDWLAAASSASSRPVNMSSSNIADEEITLWRMRLQALPSHQNPLTELRRASSVVPWIALLGRKVLAVPATSAVPERIFSAAGNILIKKRARLSCNHLEELLYQHEVWQKVREWMAIKKARLVYWLHVAHTRAHTYKHTHSYTKNPLVRIPCFFVVTNNKYQKRNRVHFRDSLSLWYKCMYTSTLSSLYHYTSTPTQTHVWFPSFLSFELYNFLLRP